MSSRVKRFIYNPTTPLVTLNFKTYSPVRDHMKLDPSCECLNRITKIKKKNIQLGQGALSDQWSLADHQHLQPNERK